MSIYPLPPTAQEIDAAMKKRPVRPFGLKAAVLLVLLQAVANAVVSYSYFTEHDLPPRLLAGDLSFLPHLPAGVIIAMLMTVLRVVAAFGLWRLQRWGWVFNMVVLCYSMAYDVAAFVQGQPHYIAMLLNVILVFYLNLQEVQALFPQTERAARHE